MTRFFLLSLKTLAFLIYTSARAEEKTAQLEPVTITGSHIPGAGTLGSVSVIEKEEIEKAPADSISDLLDLQGGIELHRRGGGEIQGDLSIRGSSSEQVLILLDGVPLNDPQTSHHDLDLPIFLNEVERVEILKGPGSSLYGTDALGGVIQIISSPPPNKFTVRGRIQGGIYSRDFYYYDRGGQAQVTLPFAKGGARISAGAETSSGFRPGTDYRLIKSSAEANPEILGRKSNLTVGYLDKEFGAQDFYGSKPGWEPWEHTQTFFAKTGINLISDGDFTLKPTISFRRHTDHFVLFRENPERYQNHHLSYTILGTLESLIRTKKAGQLALGLEGAGDWLESSNLGDHSQSRGSLAAEYSSPKKFPWELNSSVRADFHSNQATTISPSLGIGYRPMEKIRLRASSGLSYRSPSFTELYYSD
ncbi:MAG: TonB-dependent receptor, partial [Proteobacteria bacterium]|nr:TonB-dependent receptor [Pseudomonadota bacterium]